MNRSGKNDRNHEYQDSNDSASTPDDKCFHSSPGLQRAYRNRYIKITKVAIELSKTIAPKITATGTPKTSF